MFAQAGGKAKSKRARHALLAEYELWHAHATREADTFEAILRRERALALRLNYRFSLLVMEETGDHAGAVRLGGLARAFRKRVREVDVVGLLGPHRLGVIMPQTPPDAAMRVACEVCRSLGEPCAARMCHVSEYPAGEAEGAVACEPSAATASQPSCGADAPADRTGSPALSEVDEILSGGFPWWKRAVDIAVSGTALLLLSPVMAAEALIIKLVSPGPVLFRQKRVGHLGRPFNCLKFRTMHANGDTNVHRQHLMDLMSSDKQMTKLDARHDPRLIPFGRILRATSLDELPQLINVLRGEMSLVGPRPCIDYEFEHFANWQKRRCETPPGLTGLWQVNGKNKTTFRQMMCYDVAYVQKRSLALDVATLLRTPATIVNQAVDTIHGTDAKARTVGPLLVEQQGE